MTSVERVVEYTELESEAPWETEKRPPPDWPSKGLVSFNQVNFSYSDDTPPVLKGISATFQPSEKVGIVGRTGAGKSSLVSALFRLAEPKGKILIDSVVTSEIGLHDLRQKMSIIPQDRRADPGNHTGRVQRMHRADHRLNAIIDSDRILVLDNRSSTAPPPCCKTQRWCNRWARPRQRLCWSRPDRQISGPDSRRNRV